MRKDTRCLALQVAGRPGTAEAEALVRSALGECDWGAMEIEIFPGREGALLLAHPAEGTYIRKDALLFLSVRYSGDEKTPL